MHSYERTTVAVLLRAVLGMLAFAVALGLGIVAVTLAQTSFGVTGLVSSLVLGVLVSVLCVGLVLVLCRRLDRAPLTDIGVHRPRTALAGVAVVALSAAVVLGVDAALGGLRVSSVDLGTLGVFLLTNTVIALLLEAVPEEFALRGYSYTALARRCRPWLAAVGTTVLFAVAPALAGVIAAVLGALTGVPTPPASLAIGGQDPISYHVLLVVFGAMLVTARIVTGSVWACVAAHLTFLTVNRVLLVGDPAQTGVRAVVPPGGELLVPIYLVLATLGFLALGWCTRRRARRSGSFCVSGPQHAA